MALIIDPSTGNDTVIGTDVADTFIWRGGRDTYIGGGGGDTLVLESETVRGWSIGTTGVTIASGEPEQILSSFFIATSSIETYEFIQPSGDIASDFVVTSDVAEGLRVIMRGTTGDGYHLYTDDLDDTLIVRGMGSIDPLDRNSAGLQGNGGDDTFLVQIDSGTVYLYGGDGTDRLIVDAFLADVNIEVQAPTRFTPGSVLTLSWGTNTAQFQGHVEEVEFLDITEDGTPLVLSYDALANPAITGTDIGEVITDGAGNNTIQALGGNDWINMIGGNDTVDGGAGTDMISFVGRGTPINANLAEGSFTSGRTEIVSATNIENVTGTSGEDSFRGNEGANWFRGLGGSDSFYASAGGDLVNGGAGTDSYSNYFDDDTAMNISLLRGRVWDGTGEGTRLSNVEYIFSGRGDDRLTGDHVSNLLYTGHGDDTIMGNGGDDIINGEQGMDIAVYGYARDQYTVTEGTNRFGGNVVFVEYTGAGDGDGLDMLASIEILRFADGDMIL